MNREAREEPILGVGVRKILFVLAARLQRLSSRFCCVVGRLFTRAQRPDVAVRLFRMAVRLDPQHIAARHELASSLWRTDRYEEAIREYRIVADARPEDAGVLYQFGYVLRMHGLYEEALDMLTRALALETRSEIHIEIARCYSGMGRVEDAERAIERAIAVCARRSGRAQ